MAAVVASAAPRGAAAQKPAPQTPRDEDAAVRANLAGRIVTLLAELAGSAQSVADPDLRLDCEIEVASLLWPREPDRARLIFADTFDRLVFGAYASAEERAAARRRVARLLSHVARRDAALAERFATRLTPLFPPGSGRDGEAQPTSRADLLLAAALEMLPGDPARAAALGRLALSDGITPALVRFLIVLHAADAARADALFEAALGVFLRTPDPHLSDVATLSTYLVSTWGGNLAKVSPDTMRAFLHIAVQLVNRAPLDSGDAANAYFIGRQLSTFVARYLPEQSTALELRVAILAQSDGFARAPLGSATRASDSTSPDAMRAQVAATAVDREDFELAHEEAAGIRDDALRAQVYAQAALRLLKLGRFDEAYREIRRVSDPARRASLLVQLAAAAHGRGDVVRAVESLNDAEHEAKRATRVNARVQALFSVASAFVQVDPLRAFETMQEAVENVNRAARVDEKGVNQSGLPPKALNFNATFARLARIDFDGAWLLARQFDSRAPRLLAELAVCRGGLAAAGDAEEEDTEEFVPSL